MATTLESCAIALRRHHFKVIVVKDRLEALRQIEAEIEADAPETISYGDSITVQTTGIIEQIKADGRYKLFDGFDPSMPREQRLAVRRQGLMADFYITGVNAVTEQGTLHWLDMIGNRIAPIAFGPRKVVIVAGRNKIVSTCEAAEERIRTIAAPKNIARHRGFRTPCATTGICSDCDSPDRICNTRMSVERCYPNERITTILIDEDLGL